MSPAPPQIEQALSRADSLYRQGDPAGARQLCERVLAQRPGSAPARHLLALTWMASGQLEACLGHLELLLMAEPDHALAHASMGQALALAGRHDEAERHFCRAVEIEPANIEARLALSKHCLERGRFAAAENQLRAALTVAPDHPKVLVNLGGVLAQHGDADEAITLLERLLARQEAMPVAHHNLAEAYNRLGQTQQALNHYRRACALNPDFENAWRKLADHLIDLGRPQEAAEAYRAAFMIRRRPGGPALPPDSFRKTSRTKLRHDIEQLTYLIELGRLPAGARETVAAYEAALAALPEVPADSPLVEIPAAHRARLAPSYNRLIHFADAAPVAGPAINPDLDAAAVEGDYLANAPGYTVVDGLLAPEALVGLRRFCLESTIWYEARYANGYLGAFMDDGFGCPLLFQIAEGLRRRFPAIFRHHALTKLWAFKYDSRLSGIPVHADYAAVNVNFWITPDDANLDPTGGGLVLWDKQAPLDWDFKTYNADEAAMRRFLADSGAASVNVPHRQNRAVIFNSDLFHQTGEITFRNGYENRRINITMLFGKRELESASLRAKRSNPV